MTKSEILIDLDDERSGKIAEVLSNKTAKKILQALAEGEKSGSDVATELNLPLNTVTYNLKNLVEAGLIEKSKGFFWSQKGKKIERYSLANKRIVISPKKMVKSALPVIALSIVGALGIRYWTQRQISAVEIMNPARDAIADSYSLTQESGAAAMKFASTAAPSATSTDSSIVLSIAQSAWLWFLVGALFALLVYFVWNLWRQK